MDPRLKNNSLHGGPSRLHKSLAFITPLFTPNAPNRTEVSPFLINKNFSWLFVLKKILPINRSPSHCPKVYTKDTRKCLRKDEIVILHY